MTRNAFLLFSACALISACTPTIANRGNMVQQEQIDAVMLGFHTRTDVLRHLGSPTTVAPFNENIWYYIGQETQKSGILDPQVVDEKVVQVTFDEEGTVLDITEIENERVHIAVSDAETPTHGSKMTFIQQMLGNVGKFNPQER